MFSVGNVQNKLMHQTVVKFGTPTAPPKTPSPPRPPSRPSDRPGPKP